MNVTSVSFLVTMRKLVWLPLISFGLSQPSKDSGVCTSKNCTLPPPVKYTRTKPGGLCNEGLIVGRTLQNKYMMERVIGIGHNSVVYSATSEGQTVAVKCFTASSKKAMHEIAMLDKLQHPNIIQKIDSFVELSHWFLVTEYFETDLYRVVFDGKPLITQPIDIFLQVLDGVIYLHQNHVYHRDLKSANIFVRGLNTNEPVLKIGDLGEATTKEFTEGRFAGTRRYAAPEILAQKSGLPWEKNDVFALGVLLFNLQTRKQPWGTAGMNSTLCQKLESLLSEFADKYHLSNFLIEVLRKVFGASENRPTAAELKTMFIVEA